MLKYFLILLVTCSAFGMETCTDSELAQVLKTNDVSTISHCDIRTSKINGLSPLMIALNLHNEDLALHFIKAGINPSRPFRNGDTPFSFIVKKGGFSSQFVEQLAELGADYRRPSRSGRTPLMDSIISENFIVTEFLINKRVEFDQFDRDGKTALYYAIEGHQYRIVERLIDCGANFDSIQIRSNGENVKTTYVHVATQFANIRSLQFLLDLGGNPSALDSFGRSPLVWALRSNSAMMVIDELIKSGASIDHLDLHNRSMISYAIEFGRVDLLSNLNERFEENLSELLTDAIVYDNISAFKKLLNMGAKVWELPYYKKASSGLVLSDNNPIVKAISLKRYLFLDLLMSECGDEIHSEKERLYFPIFASLLLDDQKSVAIFSPLFNQISKLELFRRQELFKSIRSIDMVQFLKDNNILFSLMPDEGMLNLKLFKSQGRITSFFNPDNSPFVTMKGNRSQFSTYARIDVQVEVYGKNLFGKRVLLKSSSHELGRGAETGSFFRFQGKITDMVVSTSIRDKGISVPLNRVSCDGNRCFSL